MLNELGCRVLKLWQAVVSVVTLNYVASGDVAVGKGRVWKFF